MSDPDVDLENEENKEDMDDSAEWEGVRLPSLHCILRDLMLPRSLFCSCRNTMLFTLAIRRRTLSPTEMD
jgi:hypothetical protein